VNSTFQSLIEKIKLQSFIARRGFGYNYDMLETIYKIYVGHNKVIHYRNGYPVYSLSTPALFSKPMANFMARSFYKGIQNKNLPNLMSFAVNDLCNAGCEHCSFYEGVDDETREEMTLDQCKSVVAQAQEIGVSIINIVGGEPLLRRDLPEILKSIDKNLTTVTLFTNGWLLKRKIKELKEAGLDSVYISLDAADAATHDKFRKLPGLFDRALQGIAEAKNLGMSCGISTTMTPESYKAGELDKIIELGKTLGVHEILIFDAQPTGRYKDRKDLIDNNEWVEEMISHVKKYNNDLSYPGIVPFAYFTSHRSVGCSCGTSYFYMSPYGDLMSCDFNHAIFGNVLKEPLYKLWDRITNDPDFRQAKWGGCKIKSSDSRTSANVLSSVDKEGDSKSEGHKCSC
jgi:MoaA/NifB/PqqE/SkfB family radical SAM enzyme